MFMTLEEYFRREYASDPARPKIDYRLRISVHDDGVELYIHPDSRDGDTTPTLLVRGNTVEPKF
jgi:hypothetical protein